MLRRLVLLGALLLAATGAVVGLALAGGGSPARRRAVGVAAPSAGRRSAVPPRAQAGARNSAFWRRHVDVTASKPAPSSASRCLKPAPVVPERRIGHRQWLNGVTITEYYPSPERWFIGRRVRAPGLAGRYASDWLYSARGLAMEGSGVDRYGRRVQIAELGSTGWVNADGQPTAPVCLGKWTHGFPIWLIGGWRNRHGAVTFPLASGGWSQ